MAEYKAALIYDYDGTLAKGNIQEASFLPELGIDTKSFWEEVKARTMSEDADEVLMYMHLMLEKAIEKSNSVTRDMLRSHGEKSVLFPGLEGGEWFDRINGFAAERDIEMKHYVLSAGIYEMILGSRIARYFEKIYASKFLYQNEIAKWPSVAINYTTKTQYLFRINKGIENTWNNKDLNTYTAEDERPIPFERMIFLGDGDTDVPTMKMLTYKGGSSIAVYEENEKSREKVHSLISNGRVEFTALADYSENSQLDISVKGIIGRMARKVGYRPND